MMSTPFSSPFVAPRHRADVAPDSTPLGADCRCTADNRWRGVSCPRHDPHSYADGYARHATDSTCPIVSASGRHAGPIGGVR